MSPQIGFTCPKTGRGELFDFCLKKCLNKCMPLPVLLSLSMQDRGDEENVYHVTSILNPPQPEYLKRNLDYHRSPYSLVDLHVGSSWHEKIDSTRGRIKELGLETEYLMEKTFKKKFNIVGQDVILSGTSDLYIASEKTLYDYKIQKFFYTFKYLSESMWDDSPIPMQLNTYRVYQYPKAEAMKIFVYLKDFKLNLAEKYDLDPTETLQVPCIPDDKVKERVVELLTEHVTAQKTGKPRACTQEERWWNERQKVYLRCEHYCSAKEICEQYEKENKK